MTDLASTTDLLRRAREGDAQALDDLIRRHQGPRHGHPGRIGAGPAVRRGDLRVTLLQLHAGDDHLAFFRPKPL